MRYVTQLTRVTAACLALSEVEALHKILSIRQEQYAPEHLVVKSCTVEKKSAEELNLLLSIEHEHQRAVVPRAYDEASGTSPLSVSLYYVTVDYVIEVDYLATTLQPAQGATNGPAAAATAAGTEVAGTEA